MENFWHLLTKLDHKSGYKTLKISVSRVRNIKNEKGTCANSCAKVRELAESEEVTRGWRQERFDAKQQLSVNLKIDVEEESATLLKVDKRERTTVFYLRQAPTPFKDFAVLLKLT